MYAGAIREQNNGKNVELMRGMNETNYGIYDDVIKLFVCKWRRQILQLGTNFHLQNLSA